MSAENLENVGQTYMSSFDRELKSKRDAKYDVGLESQVCEWIETITGKKKASDQNVHDWLKSGEVLCCLVNEIRPGLIKKYNLNARMNFKMMENISLFLRACRELGMLEKDLFSTIDLFESKDMNAVISCLFNLGGTIQSSVPDFDGPRLGIKQASKFQATPLPPTATPKTRQPLVQSAPPLATPPTPVPVKESTPPLAVSVVVTPEPVFIVEAPPPPATLPDSPAPQPIARPPQSMSQRETLVAPPKIRSDLPITESFDVSPPKMVPITPTNPQPHPPQQPPVVYPSLPNPPPQPPVVYVPQIQVPTVQYPSMPRMASVPVPSPTDVDIQPRKRGPLKLNEIKQQAVSPRSAVRQKELISPADGSEVAMERAVVEWMACVLGAGKPRDVPTGAWIQSGEILCQLMNQIMLVSPSPNLILNSVNLTKFLEICKRLGLPESALFSPPDLVTGNNTPRVMACVYSLGGVLQNYEWWINSNHPLLGKRQAVVRHSG
jgi:hypothetical protein